MDVTLILCIHAVSRHKIETDNIIIRSLSKFCVTHDVTLMLSTGRNE